MDVVLRVAADDERAVWLASLRVEYLAERVQAGDDPVTAEALADDTYATLLPDGRPAEGHHVLRVVADERPVGMLWVGPQASATPDRWWVWDIVIDEPARGQGVGRRAMERAEEHAREHGARMLGLNVFGRNDVARSLYESLGYEVTTLQMRKEL